MNELLQELRAKLKLTMLGKGRQIKHLAVDKIPDSWEDFGSKGDKWINVIFPESENSTGCMYIGREGSVFDPHVHDKSLEHLTIVNPGGKMTVITDTYIKTVEYPDSIVIEKGVPHAVEFKTNTKVMIIWHPKFSKGWNADFIEEK